MKLNQTFSILMWANKAKADTKGFLPLYARVTVDGKRAEISLKKKVSPEKWNVKIGLMKGNSEEARIVNQYINQVKNELYRLYHAMQREAYLLSAEELKRRFMGNTTPEVRKSLLEVFDFHNSQLEKLVGIDVVKATATKFKTIRRKTKSFIKHQFQKEDLYLDELTYAFITGFEFYLKTVEKIDHNTAMKYILSFRKVINLSVTNGWLSSNPFQRFKCSLRKVDRNVLTQEELQQLAQRQFSIKRLEEVRDVFLFCCYTGYAFIDVEKLTPAHIVKVLLLAYPAARREETGTRVPARESLL